MEILIIFSVLFGALFSFAAAFAILFFFFRTLVWVFKK